EMRGVRVPFRLRRLPGPCLRRDRRSPGKRSDLRLCAPAMVAAGGGGFPLNNLLCLCRHNGCGADRVPPRPIGASFRAEAGFRSPSWRGRGEGILDERLEERPLASVYPAVYGRVWIAIQGDQESNRGWSSTFKMCQYSWTFS